jgi:hypothetical protein
VNEQTENLTRVKSRIAGAVVEFCRSRLRSKFTMTELVAFVVAAVGGAPDSPSRILRELRREGVVDYEVVSRAQSVYFVGAVRE